MSEPVPADATVGAFTSDPPWIVDPDRMPWRAGVDALRQTAAAQVPDLIRRRRVPPARGARVAVRLAASVVPWALRHRRAMSTPAAREDLAGRLRPAFESLGTTFIKLGQLMASAEGMLPEAWVREFRLCRDRVPAETFDHVRRVIEEDLGRPVHEVFAEFDPVPLAAASIAQVHAARLRTGEEVVVKVQRPGLDRIVSRDIATMAWLAPIIERRAPQAAVANLPAYIELFADTIVEELDFRLEAQNMLDVAAVLAVHDERAVIVPRPHPELVTRRLLVMERIRGLSLDDADVLREREIDTTPVFRALLLSFFEGAMIHGVFHGDLHGGNMVVGSDGRPCVFDFGITGRFTETKRLALLGLMLDSIGQDAQGLLRHFRDLGGYPPDADVEQLVVELDLDQLMSQDPTELSADDMAKQLRETMNRLVAHGAKLPKELFLYMKGMVYLTGAVTAVAADVDIFAEIGHLYEAIQARNADHLADLGYTDLPDTGTVADQVRRQIGLGEDVSEMTFREMQEHQQQRTEEMRAALKRSS